MARCLRFAITVAAAASLAAACREGAEPPPAPTRWVTDDAKMLRPETVQALDARLEDYQRATGHQVLVYTGTTTGGVPVEDWAVRAFERWRVGRKGIDDGAVLFVFRDDRRARVEVGYGLEDRLTDLAANRILQEQLLPRMKTGDPDGAIAAGVDAILAGIDGRAPPAASAQTNGVSPSLDDLSPVEWIAIAAVIALFLALLVTNPWLALWLLVNLASGARRGGRSGGWGGGGRGGFAGRGGRSGGGGASGSW